MWQIFIRARLRRFSEASLPVDAEDIAQARSILFAVFARYGDSVIAFKIMDEFIARHPDKDYLVITTHQALPYARVLLHFLYALTNDRDRVHSFLFGTRLDNVTRALRHRDADLAIAKVGRDVEDWSGGTRIGHCLAEFNRLWARRVLGQNALVLLFTDGLDRAGGDGIALEARRLAANSRRLIWLNPLLRYDRYQPLAAGAQALAGVVSEVRRCHNLSNLEDLASALAERPRQKVERQTLAL